MPSNVYSFEYEIDVASERLRAIALDENGTSVYEAASGFSWGPNGYGDPFDGHWRNKDGKQIQIVSMIDSYLLNCIKFLTKKFGYDTIKDWKIYRNLQAEAARRGIDGRKDWDD